MLQCGKSLFFGKKISMHLQILIFKKTSFFLKYTFILFEEYNC